MRGGAAYRHFLETIFRFLESCVHGAHNCAVLELGKAEIQRGHKARIVRHCARFESGLLSLPIVSVCCFPPSKMAKHAAPNASPVAQSDTEKM